MSIIETIRKIKTAIASCNGFNREHRDEVFKLLDTLQEQPVKELLTFDGFVDKVGSWFANLELRRFRKTFDGEIYPATELVQAYEWFVHELSEKYREKHPQGQPVCEGFDGEFSKFSNDVDAEHPFPICVDEFKDFARHFYELGRQSKPEVSEDLEEEIQSFWNRASEFQPKFATLEVKQNGFAVIARHFAQWQKEQMMKEAVVCDAEVCKLTDRVWVTPFDKDKL